MEQTNTTRSEPVAVLPQATDRQPLAPWRSDLKERIHAEFMEMPGLSLSVKQAARLFGVPDDVCEYVLSQLVEQQLLRVAPGGRCVLRGD